MGFIPDLLRLFLGTVVWSELWVIQYSMMIALQYTARAMHSVYRRNRCGAEKRILESQTDGNSAS